MCKNQVHQSSFVIVVKARRLSANATLWGKVTREKEKRPPFLLKKHPEALPVPKVATQRNKGPLEVTKGEKEKKRPLFAPQNKRRKEKKQPKSPPNAPKKFPKSPPSVTQTAPKSLPKSPLSLPFL
jgi:hypothetical protein